MGIIRPVPLPSAAQAIPFELKIRVSPTGTVMVESNRPCTPLQLAHLCHVVADSAVLGLMKQESLLVQPGRTTVEYDPSGSDPGSKANGEENKTDHH